MEDIFETLVQRNSSWLKGRLTFYKYQGFWNTKDLVEGTILAQQSFKAKPNDVLLSSCPKTGATWLKALAFTIATRDKFDDSASPLLTTVSHECIPFVEKYVEHNEDNHENSGSPRLVATHLPYTSLPESLLASNCKIVYIYRNVKDVVVSYYHYMREVLRLSMEDSPFEEAFDDFCQGISLYGPYWDHILGYWKANQQRSGILFLKYEDMKRDTANEMKKLVEFIGCPFSIEEQKLGVVEKVIKLCSFENLSNLEVNKSGKIHGEYSAIENRFFYRKAKVGDWKNYFTYEMKEKIDKLMDQKMSGTGLVLK